MYDDSNWCLVCECLVDGNAPFCSPHCQSNYQHDDDQVIYHHVAHARTADIIAWAAHIPPTTTDQSQHRLPKLLRPHRRPAPPALSVSIPPFAAPSPSRPISTHPHKYSACSSSISLASTSEHSLLSAPTESSLATPTSTLPLPIPSHKSSLLGAFASHVRSWVAPSPVSSLLVSQAFDPQQISESNWKVSAILVDPPRPRGRKTSRT
ncbi:hypothetical protein H0H92_016096 [Tricholoma furcatifolium]|nr:hypothetical protein H0H92_016096 [Tricholoma furcatifolium]